MPEFTCQVCNQPFTVSDEALGRFPGWIPKKCYRCKKAQSGEGAATTAKVGQKSRAAKGTSSASKRVGGASSATRELDLPVREVLLRFHDGPKTGVFTDGAANPNPGAGGWGAVYVVDDVIRGEEYGHESYTTNNRMELLALRAGIQLVPKEESTIIYTDSQLCVNTFNTWAKAWKARGWKRKDGEIKNLELVKEIYDLLQQRPNLKLQWIAAHNGNRWNEYADALATAYRRSEK